MSGTNIEVERPPGWHRLARRGLLAVSAGSFMSGAGLVLAAVTAFMYLHGNSVNGCLAISVAACFVVGFGVLPLGVLRLASAVARTTPGGALAALYIGSILVLVTGYFSLVLPPRRDAWEFQAAAMVIALVPLAPSLFSVGRIGAALQSLLAIEDPALGRSARRVRAITFALLVMWLLLPFTSMLPRDDRSRLGVVAALLASILFFMLSRLLWRTYRAARASINRLAHCPDCGYLRSPGTRCSECGFVPTAQEPDRERT